jgi:hypothetical protein
MLCKLAIIFSSLLLIPIILLVLLFILKSKLKKTIPGLHRPQWERDVVYVVQFPCSPHIRCISPFALKLETWLRANNIMFEPVYSLKFSTAKSQIPYVELNGVEYADSNQIIRKLTTYFKVTMDDDLTKEQRALARVSTVTLESHTAIAGFYWRYGFNVKQFCEILLEDRFPASAKFFFRTIQPFLIRIMTWCHGLGRHSEEEVAEFSCEDIQALSDILGDKDYFFGNDRPRSLDCAAFGHLAQFIYIPMAFPQQIYIKKNCNNLLGFVDRVRDTLWPDWDEMCSKECMKGRLGKDKESFYFLWK